MTVRVRSLVGAVITMVAVGVVGVGPAHGQASTLQSEIVSAVLDDGYWDETGSLDSAEMEAVVAEFGESFAFAFTNNSYEVQQDPDRSAAALLALSTLEQLEVAGGPDTLLMVTQDDATGATTEFAFANIVSTLQSFDRSAPEASFATAAKTIADLGDTIAIAAEPAQVGFFGGWGLFFVLGGVAGVLALASLRSSRKKKNRVVHTADARTSTNLEIQAMSDLILDLDPRVTIANDPELKERYVGASDTYREVLEKAKDAASGHEIADLRIDIAKARWKLDVIDAELEGRTPPDEPYTRDTSGSAWDSTRGRGGRGPQNDG